MLAFLGYAMVITFMVLIMSKKMTAFTALITVPVVFGLLGGFGLELGEFALTGVKSVSSTAAMLLFAILFFGIMISAGVFDPLVNATLKIVKGDPLKVLVGTAILAAISSTAISEFLHLTSYALLILSSKLQRLHKLLLKSFLVSKV